MNKVYSMYFSPTGSVAKIVQQISDTLSMGLSIKIDITSPKMRLKSLNFTEKDIVVLGVPVYAGRVPNLIVPYLSTIQGNGATVILIVVFGNRAYDDALAELYDITTECGFNPIAAAAFVGEHSFSNVLGKGRPDNNDLNLAVEFAHKISAKLLQTDEKYSPLQISGIGGKREYYQPKDGQGKGIDIRKVKPVTNEFCSKCGKCVRLCPMGAIDEKSPNQINGICIKCCACVKKCPLGAKSFIDEGFLFHLKDLEDKFANIKAEPIVFI